MDPDVDFPRTHANTLKSQFPKTIPADRKLCLPEYLLMFEEEHEKQVLAEEDVMTTAAYHLQAREIDLSKSVLSDLDVEKQRKRLSEISFRDNEEPNNETHKELEQKEIPHKWLTIINAAVLLKCKDKLLKGSVKFIGFVPEFGGLVGGVELVCILCSNFITSGEIPVVTVIIIHHCRNVRCLNVLMAVTMAGGTSLVSMAEDIFVLWRTYSC